MRRTFSVAEAHAVLPEARERIAEVAAMNGQLLRLVKAVQSGDAPAGGIAEAKALEARMAEGLEWFTERGIEVKGIAPALLDFPLRVSDREVLLCWLQGEERISWYHESDLGFAGRAPLSDLGKIV